MLENNSCIQSRKIGSKTMTVKLCTMIEFCSCNQLDCCLGEK